MQELVLLVVHLAADESTTLNICPNKLGYTLGFEMTVNDTKVMSFHLFCGEKRFEDKYIFSGFLLAPYNLYPGGVRDSSLVRYFELGAFLNFLLCKIIT